MTKSVIKSILWMEQMLDYATYLILPADTVRLRQNAEHFVGGSARLQQIRYYQKATKKQKEGVLEIMKNKITSVGTIIIGALLAAGPQFLFKACPTTEKVMKCFYSCKALIAVGVIVAVIGVLQLLAKETAARRSLAIAAAVGCVMAILIPTVLIGACMKPEMACNVLTFPVTHTLSVIGIVLQGITLFVKDKEANK